mmetsp:Transcript_4481/g.10526  ORF Transcript_4481/g.10526 Transcript_4481/m.10526 type:complete len:223 (+) Transcript_4481:175-843(+)
MTPDGFRTSCVMGCCMTSSAACGSFPARSRKTPAARSSSLYRAMKFSTSALVSPVLTGCSVISGRAGLCGGCGLPPATGPTGRATPATGAVVGVGGKARVPSFCILQYITDCGFRAPAKLWLQTSNCLSAGSFWSICHASELVSMPWLWQKSCATSRTQTAALGPRTTCRSRTLVQREAIAPDGLYTFSMPCEITSSFSKGESWFTSSCALLSMWYWHTKAL